MVVEFVFLNVVQSIYSSRDRVAYVIWFFEHVGKPMTYTSQQCS